MSSFTIQKVSYGYQFFLLDGQKELLQSRCFIDKADCIQGVETARILLQQPMKYEIRVIPNGPFYFEVIEVDLPIPLVKSLVGYTSLYLVERDISLIQKIVKNATLELI